MKTFKKTTSNTAVVLACYEKLYFFQLEPCTGVYAQVGKVVCEEDAVCYQYNEAFTCECKEGFIGDGWAAGAGCYEGKV